METYNLSHMISNRRLFCALALHFDVNARIKDDYIQIKPKAMPPGALPAKWCNLCRREDITVGLPSSTSVSIHYPKGHIYTMFAPALNQLISEEITHA